MTRQMLMLVPLIYFLLPIWGQDGIWYSMPISDAISFFLAAGILTYMIPKIKKHETDWTA